MDSVLQIVALILNVLLLAFMIVSGLWVAIDAHKKGRPLNQVVLWGIFTGWFIGLGLIIYLRWGRSLGLDEDTRPKEEK